MREDADTVAVADGKDVRRRRAAREVDGVRDFSRRGEGRDDSHGLVRDGVLCLLGRGADVVRADDARDLHDVVLEGAVPPGRLLREDVETRPDPLLGDRGLEGRLVHDLAAARVHEERARLHRLEEPRVEHALRLLRERAVHGHDVGRGRERVDRVGARDAEPGRAVVVQRAAPGDDRHPERLRARDDLEADRPETDDAERAAREAPGLSVHRLVPDAARRSIGLLDDAPVEGEDEAPRELRDGDRVLARAVRDRDRARRGGRKVDRVHARARTDDQRETGGAFHLRRSDLRRPDDEHLGAGLGEARTERSPFELRLVEDLAAESGEADEARLFERVGDEHFHGRTSEPVDEEAGAQLRLEPRGLRRHRDAGVGDRHDVGDLRRVHREGDRPAPGPHALLQLTRPADPADEVDSRVRAGVADAEDGTEQAILEDRDVEGGDRVRQM